jgi:hypothetical protein
MARSMEQRTDEGPGVDAAPHDGPRSPVLTSALTLLVLFVIAGAWLAYGALTRPLVQTPDRGELVAVEAQLDRVQSEIRPIATALASATATSATGTIDLAAYRSLIAELRGLVDATNGLPASSAAVLEVRDLVLTGGSQVVAGMSQALDAMASDDTTATTAAAVRVEDGIRNLESAHAKIEAMLSDLLRS